VSGRNYLVPVDAALERESDLYLQALAVDDVMRLMEAAVPTRLVILDACRNNPLARTLARAMGATRSAAVAPGLAKVEAAAGTLVAYATAPDQVALDGAGQHSPFTAALLEHMATPGLEVRQVLTRVRRSVIAATNGQQLPWDQSSLTGDLYLKVEVNVTVQAPPPPAPSPAVADGALELALWQSAERLGTGPAYRSYTGRFCPGGTFCELAEEAVRRLETAAADPAPPPTPRSEPPPPGPLAALPPPIVAEPPPTPSSPLNVDVLAALPRDAVRELQRSLTALGHDTGGADGNPGRRTRAAVESWQRATGRPATGLLTAEERTRLLVEAAPRLAALLAVPPPPPASSPEPAEPVVGTFPPDDAPSPAAAPGRTIRDCPRCPELVVVPAGRFRMGSPEDEAGRDENEGPQVGVVIPRPFAIGRFEVTFAEWDACTAAGGCRRVDDGGAGRGNRPVAGVSWDDAERYAPGWRDPRARTTGCRARRGGSTPPAPAAAAPTPGATPPAPPGPSATAAAPPPTGPARARSAAARPTPSGSATPPGTCGSGCRTAGATATPARPPSAGRRWPAPATGGRQGRRLQQPAAPPAQRRPRGRLRRQRQPQPRLPRRTPPRLTAAPGGAAQPPACPYSATFAALGSCPAFAPIPNQRAAAFRSAFTPRPFS
jgi:peptidoglycan hydrolase-like protein with peptidoglycan-binding domain